MVDTWEVSTRDDPGPSRVVLADDDVLFREGLASLLERSGFDVVGQAGDGVELLSVVRSTKPHVAIIDIRMPPSHTTEGLDAARVIREELPDTAIIVLSAHVEVDEAMDLLAGGSRLGYLLKTRVTDVDEFLTTVQRIAAGPRWSTPRWSTSSSALADGATRSRSFRRASARCWRSWPKGPPTPGSRLASSSRRARSRSMFAAS